MNTRVTIRQELNTNRIHVLLGANRAILSTQKVRDGIVTTTISGSTSHIGTRLGACSTMVVLIKNSTGTQTTLGTTFSMKSQLTIAILEATKTHNTQRKTTDERRMCS
jgi:hypothetical protein